MFSALLLTTFLYTLTTTRTLNILIGFFLFLMEVGYLFIQVNLALGIIFILIYISAIAVVLISVVLVLGSNISGSGIGPISLSLCFLYVLTSTLDTPTMLISFPKSLSTIDMSTLSSLLIVYHWYTLFLLSIYFYTVGIYLTGSFFKSLYHKSSTGLRSMTLAQDWAIPIL